MQQLDGLDIAGSQISVKIAPLTPAETAAAAAAAAGLDLDDAEGVHLMASNVDPSHAC